MEVILIAGKGRHGKDTTGNIIEEYLKEIMNLKQELRNVKMSIDIAKTGDKEVTNVDILRRVSNLEKIVYKIVTLVIYYKDYS